MFSTDAFLDRKYHEKLYNCLHFSAEVWKARTGEDILSRFGSMVDHYDSPAHIRTPRQMGFKLLEKAIDPCLALLQRLGFAPHIGVMIEHKLLHIEEQGPLYVPLRMAMLGFNDVRFYTT